MYITYNLISGTVQMLETCHFLQYSRVRNTYECITYLTFLYIVYLCIYYGIAIFPLDVMR